MPGGAALGNYVAEVAMHAWDLAAALGRPDLLDKQLAVQLLGPVRAQIPREGREPMPFGPVVETADNDPAYDQLVAGIGA